MNLVSTGSINYRFFSKINGGVSCGNFESLNGSEFVGDDEKAVLSNLDLVRKNLGADRIVTLKQVHGNEVLRVFSDTKKNQEFDALVTSIPGTAIAILTADCAPVLMYDDQKKIIGAAHAGWRGAVFGVIENTVVAMKSLGAENIRATIGPCIREKSYSVDDDFRNNFPNETDCFHRINGRLHFDLPGFCQEVLEKCGVQEVSVSDIDTYASHDQYFSYRYARQNTGGICGRNISAICIKN